jgi:multiple sugar transport system substrate-binding protein
MKLKGKLLILCLVLSFGMLFSSMVFAQAQDIVLKVMRGGYPQATKELFIEFEKEFQQEHPNVSFDIIEADWGTFHDRIGIWIRGQQEPDIYLTSIVELAPYVEIPAFLPLNDIFDEKLQSSLSEKIMAPYYFNGNLYGIPGQAGSFSFWYNKELFKEAGLDPNKPPKDWDELLEYAQKVVQNTDAYGIGLNLGRPQDFTQLLFGYLYFSATNTNFVDSDGRALFNSPEGIKAVQFMVDLVNKYKVTPPHPEELTKGDHRVLFRDGKIAMTFAGPWILSFLDEVTDLTSAETSKFAIAAPPVSSVEGKKGMVGVVHDPWVISAHTKYPELAKKVLRGLLTTKWQHKHDLAIPQMPFRQDVLDTYEYDKQWVWDVMVEDVANRSIGVNPQDPPGQTDAEIKEILNEYVLRALFGQMTVKEAMDTAANEVNKLAGIK